jgi:hypothetical protein
LVNRFVSALARAVEVVDARSPVAVNQRTGVAYGAGIGPHTEAETFKLIVEEARSAEPEWLIDATYGIPYPSSPRQKCDLKITMAEGSCSLRANFFA